LVFVYTLAKPGKCLLEKRHIQGLYAKSRAGELIKGLMMFYKSDSSIPAILIKCSCNPIFNGELPGTGTDMRAMFPTLVKMW
jgi:hypothetical protein